MLVWEFLGKEKSSVANKDEDDDEETVRSVSLKLHNRHRENAGLKPLEWDEDLEESASEYSKGGSFLFHRIQSVFSIFRIFRNSIQSNDE